MSVGICFVVATQTIRDGKALEINEYSVVMYFIKYKTYYTEREQKADI